MDTQKYCIVCGFGSHRDDWVSQDKPHCDWHTKQEVADAEAKLQASGLKSDTPPKPEDPVPAPPEPPVPPPPAPPEEATVSSGKKSKYSL